MEPAVVALLFPLLFVGEAFDGGSTILIPGRRWSVQQRLGQQWSTANLGSGRGLRLPWSELAEPVLFGARPGGLAPVLMPRIANN
jgi:hypothetical protein